MLEYSSYGARNRHLGGPTTDAGETPSPLEKLLLNSRENAVGSQTPRAYLLELAPVALRTLPSPVSDSECGTRAVSYGVDVGGAQPPPIDRQRPDLVGAGDRDIPGERRMVEVGGRPFRNDHVHDSRV